MDRPPASDQPRRSLNYALKRRAHSVRWATAPSYVVYVTTAIGSAAADERPRNDFPREIIPSRSAQLSLPYNPDEALHLSVQ